MMKRLPLIALLLLSITAAAHAAVTGSVVDESGAPIAGATVRAFAFEKPQAVAQRVTSGKLERDPIARVDTQQDGTFRLDTGGAPLVIVTATAAGRQVAELNVADGDDTGPLMIATAKPRKVRVSADGKPLANAFVAIGSVWAGKTGSDGTLEVPVMNGANSGYVAFHPDYAVTSGNLDAKLAEVVLSRGSVVKGRVVATDGKTPVPHAHIAIGSWTTTDTADDGSFTIAHAPSRWAAMRVSADNGAAVASNNGTANYSIRLRPAINVNGSVRDIKTRAGVGGMIIWIGTRFDALPVDTTITDAKGAFSFENVPDATYLVSGRHPLYVFNDPNGQQRIESGSRNPHLLGATPVARVRGVVIDEEKKPVRGAFVWRGAGGFDASRGAVTNARGEFSLRVTVPASPMSVGPLADSDVTAVKEGYASAATAAKLAAGETTTGVTITLPRGVPVTLRVIDGDQKPVEGANVSLWRFRSDPFGQRPSLAATLPDHHTTAADGTLAMRVVAGKYDINVTGDGVVTKSLPAQTLDEKTSSMNIVVERGVEVSGRVVSADGAPISEAVVQFQGAGGTPFTTVTDAGGAFVFHSAPRGAATVQATLSRTSRITSAKKDVKAPMTGVVITMPRGGTIAGHVSDASTRAPVTDFQVVASRGGIGSAPVSIQSDDGSFTVSDLAVGTTDVEIVARGYAPSTVRGVEIEEGKTANDIDVRLERGATIKGRVTSNDGQPAGDVSVSVDGAPMRRMPGLNMSNRETTDMNGDYALDGVVAGSRHVTFSKAGYVTQTKTIDAASGREATLDATLDRGRELHGRVVDESGQGVASADVRIDFEALPPTRTDPDGNFVMTGLHDQHYRVLARKNGYVEAHAEDADPNGPPVTLTLRRGGSITGHVSGLADAELTTAFVTVMGPSVSSNARIDAQGNFVAQGIPDGTFYIEASTRSAAQMRRSTRKSVDVVNGSAAPVELSFADGFAVRGRVTAHGAPLAESNVTFSPVDSAMNGSFAHADADGNYSATGLTGGDYNAYVMAAPYGVVYSDRVSINNSMTYDIDVHASAVRGRVVDAATNAPLSDAQVVFMPERPTGGGAVMPSPRPVTTDYDGRFSAGLVPERKWHLRVQREKYETSQLDVDVAQGMPDLELRLSPATGVTVRITDATDGSAVPNAYVVASDGNNQSTYSGQTAEDGTLQLWLAPGHYTIRASALHYVFASAGGDVPGPPVQIALERGGRIAVASPAAAHVRLIGAGANGMMSFTGRFENVRPGNYVIELLSKDNKTLQRKDIVVVASQTTTVTF